MTENEAKQWLKHTRAYQHKCDNCEYIDIKGACNEECKDFYDMAIQALEEIQQYRAIGTVEELQSKLEAYRELGTMEELKALKEKNEQIPIIHGKAELELHDKGIRNKVIDEFAERLSNKDNIVKFDIDEVMSNGNFDYNCDCLRKYIDEIAEQLKGGAT